MKLQRYLAVLENSGQNEQQRADVAASIRRKLSLRSCTWPAIPGQMEESLALFGDVRSQPLNHFMAGERSLIFRLSDFVSTCSSSSCLYHFTRMLEGVER